MHPKQLPIFKGYTIDVRLRQFRKVIGQKIIFIEFDSEKGENLLSKYIESLNRNSRDFKELINYL